MTAAEIPQERDDWEPRSLFGPVWGDLRDMDLQGAVEELARIPARLRAAKERLTRVRSLHAEVASRADEAAVLINRLCQSLEQHERVADRSPERAS